MEIPRIEGNPYIIAGLKEGAPRADLKGPWERPALSSAVRWPPLAASRTVIAGLGLLLMVLSLVAGRRGRQRLRLPRKLHEGEDRIMPH